MYAHTMFKSVFFQAQTLVADGPDLFPFCLQAL